MVHSRVVLVLVGVLLATAHVLGDAQDEADYAALTAGVTAVDFSGAVGSVLLVKEHAIPLVVASGQVVAGTARLDAGRVAGFTHGGFLSGVGSDNGLAALMLNVAKWAGDTATPVVGMVAGKHSQLRTLFADEGWTVTDTTPTTLDADGIDVFVCNPSDHDGDDAGNAAINTWARAGGGVVMGGTTWAFHYPHGFSDMTTYPGNVMADGSGLVFRGDYPYLAGPPYTIAAQKPTDWYNVAYTFATLPTLTALDDDSQIGMGVATTATAKLKPKESFPDTFAAATDAAAGATFPGPDGNIMADSVNATLVMLNNNLAREIGVDELYAHQSAGDFPGQPGLLSTARSVTLTVPGAYEGLPSQRIYASAGAALRVSTGVYAAAGDVVTVTVPAAVVDSGVGVLVGAHSDNIKNRPEWKRNPLITRWWSIAAESTQVGCVFGGIVYITVPKGSALDDFEVTVAGAHPYPYFALGTTTEEEWEEVRNYDVPWGELEGHRFIMTVQTDNMKQLQFSEVVELLEMWDDVMDAGAELAAVSVEYPRKERIVVDLQISAGWMHSGYPIMAHLATGNSITNRAHVMENGEWGVVHERGHNLQWRDWVVPYSTEVGCNLFSVYCSRTVFGIQDAHSQTSRADREGMLEDYMNGGAQYEEALGPSPWIHLMVFLFIEDEFSFDVYKRVFATYNEMDSGAIATEDRIDWFVYYLCKETGVNLVPYFDSLNYPISDTGRERIAMELELQPWRSDPTLRWHSECGDSIRYDEEECDSTAEKGCVECACATGFAPDPNGGVECTDVDECALGTDNCVAGEECTNIFGGFQCSGAFLSAPSLLVTVVWSVVLCALLLA